MDISSVKQLLESCHNAKRITELMPKLPAGMTPRHIHVIDAICEIEKKLPKYRIQNRREQV